MSDEGRRRERAFLGPTSEYPLLWAAMECPELVQMPAQGRTSSPLDRMRVEGAERLTWRRGFVEEVRCPAAEWLRHGVAVRQRNPVRVVRLMQCNSLERDVWYSGLPTLKGLTEVFLESEDRTLTIWLSHRVPGTIFSLMEQDN